MFTKLLSVSRMYCKIWLTCWIVLVSFPNIYHCSYSARVAGLNDTFRIRYEFQIEDDTFDFTQTVDTKLFNGINGTNCSSNDHVLFCFKWDTVGQFEINRIDKHCDEYHYWTKLNAPLHVAFDRKNVYLSGGGEMDNQTYPISVVDGKIDPFVSTNQNSQSVLEAVWYTDTGFYLKVDQNVPLFVSYEPISFNIIANRSAPYIRGDTTHLKYRVCKYDNLKIAFERAVADFLGKPKAPPDYRMVELPIWSTWAKYKRDINEKSVLEFANLIKKYGFPNSQLEIDDMWETCYGSLAVDPKRFPDMKGLVDKLHSMGFRVTIWVHPFVNIDCQPFYTEGSVSNYFVKNTNGSIAVSWWNGNGAYIDFTNSGASDWYQKRLQKLLKETGIDSLKFDAGESAWSPQVSHFYIKTDDQPEIILKSYVQMAASYGNMVEVRSARQTQQYPIFVRIMDRDTRWTGRLGLNTLIPELLHMNVIGYPYVLPDMIGGNGYDNSTLTKEMFIRWLQANVFMPSMQFSFPPWDFDEEVVNITLKYVELHKRYAPKIYELMKLATSKETMVNAPIWWIDPTDVTAQKIDSEFLLGDILVAPVLEKGATSRNIYFPRGTWRDETIKNASHIIGPTWVKNYKAGLEVLPYFTKISINSSTMLSPSLFITFIISLLFFYK